jgi:hypothetical protein
MLTYRHFLELINSLRSYTYLRGIKIKIRTGKNIFRYGYGAKPNAHNTASWINCSNVKKCIIRCGTLRI